MTKEKKPKKKLNLKKDAVRVLTRKEADSAKGGANTTVTGTCSGCSCQPGCFFAKK